jgi:hypothetical protein
VTFERSISNLTSRVNDTLSNLAGFGGEYGIAVKTAHGVGTMIIDNVTERSNDPSGISPTMHTRADEAIASSQLTQHAVND